jgi:uncharacterized membrane protein (DUF373 family)
MKKIFLHGVLAGISSATMSLIYFKIYQTMLDTTFEKIIGIGAIIGASFLSCTLMAVGYFLLSKFRKENIKGLLNIIISTLSFASIIGVISISLPLDIEDPELFLGLAVPMHFFPALAFFTLAPFFRQHF